MRLPATVMNHSLAVARFALSCLLADLTRPLVRTIKEPK